MKKIFITSLLGTCVSLCMAQKQGSTDAKPAPKAEMKAYTLVLLKSGPNRTQDSTTSAQIQAGHMAHIQKMYADGKIDLAGPLLDNSALRGIMVFNVADTFEVRKLTNEDPAVRYGRLVAEIHPWFSQKGALLR